MLWRYEKVNNRLRLGAISVGVLSLASRLVKLVKDTFQKLRSKLSALLSTLAQRLRSAVAKLKGSNS